MSAAAPEPGEGYEFPSLRLLKDAHLQLLQLESPGGEEDAASATFLDSVRDFMLRASATGRILDDDKDRGVAQTLLNYWATVLFRAGVPDDTVPVTSLAELEENAGRELDESQCPYCGLYAYSEATAHLFFGRKHVIEKWLESLRQKPLLVALGPSGSGKTSLVRAGLLTALRAGRLPGSETWKITESTLTGEDSAVQLLTALETGASAEPALLIVHRLDEGLFSCEAKTQRKLISAFAKWLSAPGEARRAVLVGRLESTALVTQWLREGGLTEKSSTEFIPPFEARELRAVIEQPAEPIGLRFEEGLVDTLINDFLGDPAALALLQFMLLKLWDKRERNHITWKAYHEIGGGQRAVEMAAESVYSAAEFDDEDRELTQKIFLRLVRPTVTRALAVHRAPESALAATPEARDRTRKVIARFEAQHLLRDPQRTRRRKVGRGGARGARAKMAAIFAMDRRRPGRVAQAAAHRGGGGELARAETASERALDGRSPGESARDARGAFAGRAGVCRGEQKSRRTAPPRQPGGPARGHRLARLLHDALLLQMGRDEGGLEHRARRAPRGKR